jgi:hypothetical protein
MRGFFNEHLTYVAKNVLIFLKIIKGEMRTVLGSSKEIKETKYGRKLEVRINPVNCVCFSSIFNLEENITMPTSSKIIKESWLGAIYRDRLTKKIKKYIYFFLSHPCVCLLTGSLIFSPVAVYAQNNTSDVGEKLPGISPFNRKEGIVI